MMENQWPCLVWGTVKLGRTTQLRTPVHTLPSDTEAERLVRQMVTLGIRAFDTAPAYGASETRLGLTAEPHISISTKQVRRMNETKPFDFSAEGVKQSLRSQKAQPRTTGSGVPACPRQRPRNSGAHRGMDHTA